MSKQQNNVVYVESGFLPSKELINSKFNVFDVVELRAKDRFIELAIQLSQYFVKEGIATYDKFTSSLTTNSNEQSIPQVAIKLYYQPQKPKENPVERKQYRKREHEDRGYREEDSYNEGRREERRRS